MNSSSRAFTLITTPPSSESKYAFNQAERALGRLFISPLEVNHWLPFDGVRHYDGDIAIMIHKMQAMDFLHLRNEGELLVAGPATPMTTSQIYNLAIKVCSSAELELKILTDISNHPRFADSQIDAHRWILIPRTLTQSEFMAMNPSLVLYAELVQLLARDNHHPLVIKRGGVR